MQETTKAPDPQRLDHTGQLDPSGKGYAYYQIVAEGRNVLADIIVTNTDQNSGDPGAMVAKTEYWRIHAAPLSLASYPTVALTKTEHDWSGPQAPPFSAKEASFSTSQAPAWSPDPLTGLYQTTPAGDGLHAALRDEDGVWQGTIVFVRGPANHDLYLFMAGGAQLSLLSPQAKASFSPALFNQTPSKGR